MAFESPAQNYIETRLNLGDIVRLSPVSTYLMRSESTWSDYGVVKGSVLAIDRSLMPVHGQLVVAEIDGELTLRRLLLNPLPALELPAGEGSVFWLDKDLPLPVWGVVAYALNDIAGLGFNGPAAQ